MNSKNGRDGGPVAHGPRALSDTSMLIFLNHPLISFASHMPGSDSTWGNKGERKIEKKKNGGKRDRG